MNQVLGGVTKNDAIKFQFRILLGSNGYKMIKCAKNNDDIIAACLRAAWADTFRHTTKNNSEWDKKNDEGKNNAVCELLHDKAILEKFKKYAEAEATKDLQCAECTKELKCTECIKGKNYKISILYDNLVDLAENFKKVKLSRDGEMLRFGHFQKLFNMALKYYLCIYFFQEELGISNSLEKPFFEDVEYIFKNADCPVDSNILQKIDERLSKPEDKEFPKDYIEELRNEYGNQKFVGIAWSSLGKDDNGIKKYISIQKVISKLLKDEKSNLYFDFKNWRSNLK